MIRNKVIAAVAIVVFVAFVAAFAASVSAQSSLAAAIAATLFAIGALVIVVTSRRRVLVVFIIGACLSTLAGISQLFSDGDAPLGVYLSAEGVVSLLCGAILAAGKRERRGFRRTD